MKPERWRRITDVFHRAIGRDAASREAFLTDVAAADPGLRSEVESLLEAHRDAGRFGNAPLPFAPALLQRGSVGRAISG